MRKNKRECSCLSRQAEACPESAARRNAFYPFFKKFFPFLKIIFEERRKTDAGSMSARAFPTAEKKFPPVCGRRKAPFGQAAETNSPSGGTKNNCPVCSHARFFALPLCPKRGEEVSPDAKNRLNTFPAMRGTARTAPRAEQTLKSGRRRQRKQEAQAGKPPHKRHSQQKKQTQ